MARFQDDLNEFARENELEHVVVVNVASTEPAVDAASLPPSWADFESSLAAPSCPVARQFALRDCGLGLGLFVHQFHAVAGGVAGGHRRAVPAARRTPRRLRRQDRRDVAQKRAGPDDGPSQLARPELGRPQYLRQPGRAGVGRSGQQASETQPARTACWAKSSATARKPSPRSSTSKAWANGRRPGTTSISPGSWARP